MRRRGDEDVGSSPMCSVIGSTFKVFAPEDKVVESTPFQGVGAGSIPVGGTSRYHRVEMTSLQHRTHYVGFAFNTKIVRNNAQPCDIIVDMVDWFRH
jgi:hypothetical protein